MRTARWNSGLTVFLVSVGLVAVGAGNLGCSKPAERPAPEAQGGAAESRTFSDAEHSAQNGVQNTQDDLSEEEERVEFELRAKSRSKMQPMAIAVQQHHGSHGVFPPWTAPNQQQQPVHSWQTYLLPVLGKAELFNSIDYSAPYDAPANRHVFSAVIDEFLNPVEAGAHSINEFGASHYAGNVHVLGTRQPMSLDKVTDGAGQTILLGEVGAGFRPWGDPRNVRDPAAGIGVSAEQFGRSSRDGVQFLMIDGSVRFFSSDTDPSVLKALATPAGNERLPGSTY